MVGIMSNTNDDMAYERRFKQGDYLFCEGDVGDCMYYIQEGVVEITKQCGDGSTSVAKIGKNGVVGEMALLDHAKRSASARAYTDVSTIEIGEKKIRDVIDHAPSWFASIIKVIVQRLRNITEKKSLYDIENSFPVFLYSIVSHGVHADTMGCVKIPLALIKNDLVGILGLSEDILYILLSTLENMGLAHKGIHNDVEVLVIVDMVHVKTYYTLLLAKFRKRHIVGENLTKEQIDLLKLVSLIGKEHGEKANRKIMIKERLIKTYITEQSDHGKTYSLARLRQLKDAGIISIECQNSQEYGTVKNDIIIFSPTLVSSVLRLHILLPLFNRGVEPYIPKKEKSFIHINITE